MATGPKVVREDEEDFEAFWAQHRAQQTPETKRILGVDVEVPTDMRLSFEDTLEELSESDKREDLERVLEILFGVDVLGRWKANGCTSGQLRVLMAWGMANASGKPTSFAEAAELVTRAEQKKAEDEAGKAVPINRAARRASSKTRGSAKGGATSKRTSRANTA